MSEYKFVTHMIEGMEGMVRGMFANRNLQGSNASRIFPGVANVAILPKEFADEQSASDYLQKLMEKGGNAAAVKIVDTGWLVCAWVDEAP
ncbi:MAG: hypothetical protein IIB71_16935 [Proteobacteria bacterium]|nr:hypothetical protein [Pseudomonadota bacterium]